jgi:hypothetical protein
MVLAFHWFPTGLRFVLAALRRGSGDTLSLATANDARLALLHLHGSFTLAADCPVRPLYRYRVVSLDGFRCTTVSVSRDAAAASKSCALSALPLSFGVRLRASKPLS